MSLTGSIWRCDLIAVSRRLAQLMAYIDLRGD